MAPPRNRRPGFSRRAQYGLFLGYVGLVGGMLIAAGLLLLSIFNPPAFGAVRGFFSEITTPVASAFTWVRTSVAGVPEGVSSYVNVRGENARLKKQIADNDLLVERARTLNQENRHLREMLKLHDVSTDAVVVARRARWAVPGAMPRSTRAAGRA
jgi:rod shape-determining protein MreC